MISRFFTFTVTVLTMLSFIAVYIVYLAFQIDHIHRPIEVVSFWLN